MQKRKNIIYELLLILGLPLLAMALCTLFKYYPLVLFTSETSNTLVIVVQPFRFVIIEELGCNFAVYSYVGYVIQYAPLFVTSLGCVILARKFS